ncbi:MAG TPA: SDR family oxidoreductase [Nitrososphaeraceae archaeon]|nr:SDR family oxidoreductase [Nitrososphaeraceae archaeon]
MSNIGSNSTAKDKNRKEIISGMSTKNVTKEQEKIAVVTGSSSGIGFETSLLLAKNGFRTYATVRNPDKAKALRDISDKGELPIHVVELDVDSDKSVKDAIDRIKDESGRIDVLVNNAGYALFGALEDLSMDEIKAQFETNLFGAIRVMKAVLPIMRKKQGGTIVNVSSIGGRISFPLSSAYHGTKFALEGVSESLRYETQPFGIKVVLIEPGVIGSNFLRNVKLAQMALEPTSPYAPMVQTLQKASTRIYEQATPPEEVAKVILKAVTIDNPDLRYLVGNDAIQMIQARKGMSDQEFGVLLKQQVLAQ